MAIIQLALSSLCMVDKCKSEIQSCREEIINKLTADEAISTISLHRAASLLLELSTVESRLACEEEDRLDTESSGEIAWLKYELNPYLDKYKGFFLTNTRILHRELSRYRKYQLPTNVRIDWQESTNSTLPAGEIRYSLNPYALYYEAEFESKYSDVRGKSLSCISADNNSSTVFFTLGKCVYELNATTNKIINIFNNFKLPSYICVCPKYFYIVDKVVHYSQHLTASFVLKCDRSTGEVVARSEEEEHNYFGITLDSVNRLFVGKNSSLCIYNNDLVKEREIELRISHRNKKHPCIRDLHLFNEQLFMLVYGTFYPFQVFSTDGVLLRVFELLSPINSFYFAIDSAGNILFNDFRDKLVKICNQRREIYHNIELKKSEQLDYCCYPSCICILEPFLVVTHNHTRFLPAIFFL